MINRPSKDLTLIVYDNPRPPRYLRLNKRILKLVFIFTPFIIVAFLLGNIIYSANLKYLLEVERSSEPEVITELRKKNQKLEKRLASEQKRSKDLLTKIAKGSSEEEQLLSLFQLPLGFENTTDKNLTRLENFSFEIKNQKIIFKFDLKNNRPGGGKVAGYFRIAQSSVKGHSYFPPHDLDEELFRIKYNRGESFTVSRFRPVVSEFELPQNAQRVWYNIFLFSRTGDLIHNEAIGPY